MRRWVEGMTFVGALLALGIMVPRMIIPEQFAREADQVRRQHQTELRNGRWVQPPPATQMRWQLYPERSDAVAPEEPAGGKE